MIYAGWRSSTLLSALILQKGVPTITTAKLSGQEDGSAEVELISKLSTASWIFVWQTFHWKISIKGGAIDSAWHKLNVLKNALKYKSNLKIKICTMQSGCVCTYKLFHQQHNTLLPTNVSYNSSSHLWKNFVFLCDFYNFILPIVYPVMYSPSNNFHYPISVFSCFMVKWRSGWVGLWLGGFVLFLLVCVFFFLWWGS